MNAPRLDAAGEAMLFLLGLLADTKELYRQAGQRGRQVLNPALFAKVYCDADETRPYVASDELSNLVLPLVSEARNDSGTALVGGAAVGSSKNRLVEVPGIEPGSFAVLSGLLRAQLTMPLLGPGVHVSKMP